MSTELSRIDQVPEWMIQDGRSGAEELSKFVIPPRLIIKQPLAKGDLSKFGNGNVLIMPEGAVIGEYDATVDALKKPFHFVPLLFWMSYTIDNPREVWKQHGRIRGISFDHESVIAQNARDLKKRKFPCPELPAKECQHTSRINYLWAIMAEGVPIVPTIVTFKRGEARTGMDLNGLIRARNAPVYGCVFEADVSKRENDDGMWYGLNIANPSVEGVKPWVDNKELYETFKRLHEELKAAHANQLIKQDDDESDLAGEDQSAF